MLHLLLKGKKTPPKPSVSSSTWMQTLTLTHCSQSSEAASCISASSCRVPDTGWCWIWGYYGSPMRNLFWSSCLREEVLFYQPLGEVCGTSSVKMTRGSADLALTEGRRPAVQRHVLKPVGAVLERPGRRTFSLRWCAVLNSADLRWLLLQLLTR